MVSGASVCLRFLAEGARRDIVGSWRFLSNPRVSVEALVDGWGARTAQACEGRHVLALQDTSEIHFTTRKGHERGLGRIGRGNIHGVLLHAVLAVDAEDGGCLGLATGRVWTRAQEEKPGYRERAFADRESSIWPETAGAAKEVLARARMVTIVADRESDIYEEWARLPEDGFHLLIRARGDRRTREGLLSTARFTSAGTARFELRERTGRPARTACLEARFSKIALRRPSHGMAADLPGFVELSQIEVVEVDPPPGADPVHWRLLTTHDVADAAFAWRIVGWYRARWAIEQLFRTLKQQGLRLEDSQVENADRLIKLTAIAAHAACIVMQLTHARDGTTGQRADIVFTPPEIDALEALVTRLEGKTDAQKNPHPRGSLARAAWVIGKLGGWDGYAKSKPPGPITFRRGLEKFKSIAKGWELRDV